MPNLAKPMKCPEGYPHGFCTIGTYPPTLDEMMVWCRKQFGRGNSYRRWHYDAYGRIFFRFPEDAFAFKMRWL